MGEIHSSEFKFSDVIVYADTFETNYKMSARVINSEDWYSGISGEGSVEVNSKAINLYLESSNYYENSYQLVRKSQQEKRELTDKEVEEAEQKDEEYKKQAEKNMIAELKRVGLALDPKTQTAVFFPFW